MAYSYLVDVAERAVKTAAQAAVGVLGVDALGVLDVDWAGVASVSGLAAVLSVLTSIASTGFGVKGTASAVSETPVRPV